jgi:polyisoprenyl-teichoic acid--peptidoglycan teichoic acid transferase
MMETNNSMKYHQYSVVKIGILKRTADSLSSFGGDQMQANQKRKWLRITGSILLLLLIGAGVYGYSVYKSLTTAVNTMHKPIARDISEKRIEEIKLPKKEPFSVLMLGVDERKGDKGRSDTMIVLTVNPTNNTVKMLSIPRDTRTQIIGKGKEDKINHAYAFGGVEMAMATVENFLDIPVDYYIKVNMEGFKDIVNSVGGVKVYNDLDFSLEGTSFPVGELQLNGEKALKFSRMRYEDPRGDFGRQFRQREIIKGIINSGKNLSSLTKYNEILTALGDNIQTNLTLEDMMAIRQNYQTAAINVEQMTLTGTGKRINSVYYIVVPDEEKQRIQTELKNQLGLATLNKTA